MLVLRGAPALSEFRQTKLIERLGQSGITVNGIYAEFVHLVNTTQALTDDARQVLDKLLTYGPKAQTKAPTGECFFVTPRPGTISPWSSKATNIAQNCGLTAIDRIERGCAYYVDVNGELSDADKALVAAELHD